MDRLEESARRVGADPSNIGAWIELGVQALRLPKKFKKGDIVFHGIPHVKTYGGGGRIYDSPGFYEIVSTGKKRTTIMDYHGFYRTNYPTAEIYQECVVIPKRIVKAIVRAIYAYYDSKGVEYIKAKDDIVPPMLKASEFGVILLENSQELLAFVAGAVEFYRRYQPLDVGVQVRVVNPNLLFNNFEGTIVKADGQTYRVRIVVFGRLTEESFSSTDLTVV